MGVPLNHPFWRSPICGNPLRRPSQTPSAAGSHTSRTSRGSAMSTGSEKEKRGVPIYQYIHIYIYIHILFHIYIMILLFIIPNADIHLYIYTHCNVPYNMLYIHIKFYIPDHDYSETHSTLIVNWLVKFVVRIPKSRHMNDIKHKK